jgi:hypothetical protein
MDWLNLIPAAAAVASPFIVWLLKANIKQSLDLTLHREIEELKSSLSVRAEFAKLVAQKRFESLLDIWSLSVKFGAAVFNRPEQESLATMIQHMDAVLKVEVVFPQETADAIHKFQSALSDLQLKMHRAQGDELSNSFKGAHAASGEFRDYVRRVFAQGFPDDAPTARA